MPHLVRQSRVLLRAAAAARAAAARGQQRREHVLRGRQLLARVGVGVQPKHLGRLAVGERLHGAARAHTRRHNRYCK